MKSSVRRWSWILVPLAVLAVRLAVAAPAAPLKLPDFGALSAKASESVTISLDPALLGVASAFLDPGDPDEAGVKQLIAGLKGIYVRSYTFDADIPYPAAEVELLQRQLAAPGWAPLVDVRNSKDRTHVNIYLSVDQGKANGLVIIASQPREFTVVNIVGAIDLEKLRRLEGKLGIPKVPLPEAERLPSAAGGHL